MKILAVAGDIDIQRIGGAEAHFIEVLKRIAPKLEKVTVLVGENTSLKNAFVNIPNVEIIKVKYPKVPNLSWLVYSFFSLPYAIRADFDLVWLKQEYLAWNGLILKILIRKPVYVTCQNPNLATEEWVGKGILAVLFQKTLGKIFNGFLMFPLRFANTVAAVSSYSASLAKKYGAKRVVIIPNGVTC